jgi:feruloyl esterase
MLALMGWFAFGAAQAATPDCGGVRKVSLPHTQITGATLVAAGDFTPPAGARSLREGSEVPAAPSAAYAGGSTQSGVGLDRNQFRDVPAFCRVTAVSKPGPRSNIRIEIWLPTDWNGRLLASGNSGLQGAISYAGLAAAVRSGYAGVGSNAGIEGDAEEFARITSKGVLADWGNRSIHEMILAAKATAKTYYSSAVKYSYWNSCSTGGRQGEVAAEYYPNDFDGLVIGDAANPMTHLQVGILYSSLTMDASDATFMSPAKWETYRKGALAKCDAADGVKDGLLSDPEHCNFDPRDIQCQAGDRDDCLTAAEIGALNKVLAGLKNPRTGEQIWPGYPIGTMPSSFVIGKVPNHTAVGLYQALMQNPNWDYHTVDFDRDVTRVDREYNDIMNATHPERVKRLFDHGGKIIMYHGWDDGGISPLMGINFYKGVVAANGGKDKTYNSIRLFMVPGMLHCGGGDGPNLFDKMGPITDWVENGRAPDWIVASHKDKTGKVDRTRPLCPYPQVAKYKGLGNTDDASNFTCANP